MSKTKSKRICEWFFKVVEAQRTLSELDNIGEEKDIGITLCIGSMDDTIHIHKPEQFDRLVEALTSVYGEAFVGEIKDEVSTGYNEEFVWRSFKYAEFEVGTIAR